MVNLSKYAGKRIKATFRSGDSLIGVLQVNKGTDLYPYWFLGSSYTQGGLRIGGSEDRRDIISIKLLEETPMSNKVDLSKYVGKEIKATFRSGESREGLVGLDEDSSEWYPYTFCCDTYTKDGQWYHDVECMRDIISISCEDDPQPEPAKAISCEDDPQPEPAKAIYIAWLDNQFICALPSRQDVKDYIKLKHSDVDPFDVIILTEAYKSDCHE